MACPAIARIERLADRSTRSSVGERVRLKGNPIPQLSDTFVHCRSLYELEGARIRQGNP
jgi:hypothetical protein